MRIFKSIVFVVLFAAVTFVRADSDYVVVSAIATNDDASWKTVVEGLQKKHGATVVTWSFTAAAPAGAPTSKAST